MKIVDTDILIDFSYGHLQAAELLSRLEEGKKLSISQVTEMEYLIGCRNQKQIDQAQELLSRFCILPIKETYSRLASEFLQSFHLRHGIGILDCLIAATAITEKISLVSRNKKHYRIIPNLNLEVPY